jgi:hypothetical protein
VLFNIFINNLFTDIKALDIGIDIEGEKIGILLYADDIETPVNCIICFLEIYKDSKS